MLRILVAAVSLLCLSAPLSAQGAEERFWVLWEHIEKVGQNCPNGTECKTKRTYASRLFEPASRESIYRLFGMLDFQAAARGEAADHADAPRICQHNDAEVLLGFDPERLRISDKLDALTGLYGVHIDVRNLKAPSGYSGDFGAGLQKEFEARFKAAGIRILSEEQMLEAPGQPKLNIYFSNTNQSTGCTYSVFASLSQTVLLTRNIRTKLTAGTWAFSTGPSTDFPNAHEYDAILRVADAFVRDYLKANPEIR
ncbi:MAG: hypothetical protein ABJO27_06285 [Pseudoruegeria sp.]